MALRSFSSSWRPDIVYGSHWKPAYSAVHHVRACQLRGYFWMVGSDVECVRRHVPIEGAFLFGQLRVGEHLDVVMWRCHEYETQGHGEDACPEFAHFGALWSEWDLCVGGLQVACVWPIRGRLVRGSAQRSNGRALRN